MSSPQPPKDPAPLSLTPSASATGSPDFSNVRSQVDTVAAAVPGRSP